MLVERAQSGSHLLALQGSIEGEKILLVYANEGMELDTVVLAEHDIANDDTGLFHKTGDRNGGFETLNCVDQASIVGNRPATSKVQLIDRLFNRPVDCFLCHRN